MEIRVLQYFLAVARERSISKAAEALHLSQPTLSRQLKDLEDELGSTLFERGARQIRLTDEGIIFKKRAEEICQLVEKTLTDMTSDDKTLTGEVFIGAAESYLFKDLAIAIKNLNRNYPLVKFTIVSGDGESVYEQLSKGLVDFGLVFGEIDKISYNSITLPETDTWGLLVRKDSEFADYDRVTADDLIGKNIIISRQSFKRSEITEWLGDKMEQINFVAKINLIYNASIMVEEGFGYAITLDKLVSNENLKFIPLYPEIHSSLNLVWKKYQMLTDVSKKFLGELEKVIEGK